ncbi:Type II/IV secretion system protein [Cedecea sp. NFIX57]|nr:ATPase, T2SS/T4P/T4SS family [Cedecea sp. NFIX57]SMG59239.1 Type II/IV secretion system protein [Cedecea sp. NFIX57]
MLRLLASSCPDLKALKAPPQLCEVLEESEGLILVTGATGRGKYTTLAAMIQHLSQHFDGDVLMLEDPIEFNHPSGSCLIQQREPGLHCERYVLALKAVLREDPDVIPLGELRDSETTGLALTAADPESATASNGCWLMWIYPPRKESSRGETLCWRTRCCGVSIHVLSSPRQATGIAAIFWPLPQGMNCRAQETTRPAVKPFTGGTRTSFRE